MEKSSDHMMKTTTSTSHKCDTIYGYCTEIDAPHLALPQTDTPDPTRANFLTLMQDPKLTKLKTLV